MKDTNQPLLNTFISLSILVSAAISQGSPLTKSTLLVSPEWLSERLDDPSLIMLHVGSPGEIKERIPRAKPISFRGLMERTSERNLSDELPSPAQLDSVFELLGISDSSLIVIYYENEMLIPMASRLFVTLDYFGLGGNSHILNGGLRSWKNKNLPVSTDASRSVTSSLNTAIKEELMVDADWVLENLQSPEVTIIDARPAIQYSGKRKEHKSWRAGHIAGAVNIPFYELTDGESPHRFLSDTDLAQRFVDAGVVKGSTLVTYCGTGIWACPVYVAAKHLGYTVKFYDGGFEEWSANPELPITGPVKRSWFR